jgi:hypothetical protein
MTAGLLNSCKDLGRDFVFPFGIGGEESDGHGAGRRVPAATGTEGPKRPKHCNWESPAKRVDTKHLVNCANGLA